MPHPSLFEITGFKELNEKLKRLPDKLKRIEVLKLQRKLLKPAQQAYSRELPKDTGNLSKSVQIKTVPASKVHGNPSVVVLPGKAKGSNGYYRFMVVKKGTKLGSNKRGSRAGKNKVVHQARDRAYRAVQSGLTREYEQKMTQYIQRLIDKL